MCFHCTYKRSYLFYCKHVTANPCVCSASAERSESKHTRTGAQTSYALYACRKRPLYWPSQWLYPDLRLGEFENFAHGNSAYALSSNTVTSNYTIKEKKTSSSVISLPSTKTESSSRHQFNEPLILVLTLFCFAISWPLTWTRVDTVLSL